MLPAALSVAHLYRPFLFFSSCPLGPSHSVSFFFLATRPPKQRGHHEYGTRKKGGARVSRCAYWTPTAKQRKKKGVHGIDKQKSARPKGTREKTSKAKKKTRAGERQIGAAAPAQDRPPRKGAPPFVSGGGPYAVRRALSSDPTPQQRIMEKKGSVVILEKAIALLPIEGASLSTKATGKERGTHAHEEKKKKKEKRIGSTADNGRCRLRARSPQVVPRVRSRRREKGEKSGNMATRGLAMPLLPSDAVPRGDVDGRGAVDTGSGSSSSSGGAIEGGSSYYQMFMRAIHAGGLHGGIFRDEAPLTLLRCMERAAHECLAHVDDALVRKGFVGRVYEEALGRALDTFGAWTGAMLDEETQRIVDAHPQIDTVLFRSVCAAYVREVHADTLRTGQRASIRLPAFGDFVREFFRHLAADPYVRSAAYFDRTRLAERKLVHVDAVRASLEQCMRNKVTFVAAPPPTPAATSTYASSPASSSTSTSSSSSSSSSPSSSSSTVTSSASTAPTPSPSVSASTPSASTPAPPPTGPPAPRGADADGAQAARSRVAPGDAASASKMRPQATLPARTDRSTPARTSLPAGPPRDAPTLAPGDFGPVADGRPRSADDAAMDRQQPQIAGAFASRGPRRPDRPWPADGGHGAFARGACAAAEHNSTIDMTSATGDEGDDESFHDPRDMAGRRDLDVRQTPPITHFGRATVPHMRDAPGMARQQGVPWPPPPSDGMWPPDGGHALQAGPTGPLVPLPPRRGHARPAVRLVDEPAAPRYVAQPYGAAQASRRPYSFPHAGAYHAAVDHSDNDRHDPNGGRGDDDVLGDNRGGHDEDDDDDDNGDCENDGVMGDDDSRGANYTDEGQWSG